MEQGSIQSINRAFELIELLSQNAKGMAITALAQETGMHKSTVHRIVTSLAALGYIAQDQDTSRYKLTMRMYSVGSRVIGGQDLLSVARPSLEYLSETLNEVVHLVVRDGTEVVYLLKEDSSSGLIRSGSHINFSNPMYCTGVGKAILAYLSDEELVNIWNNSNIVMYTESTTISLPAMRKELEAIRRRRYAIDNEEFEPGLRCVACPIFDYTQHPIAAVSISAPISRMPEETVQKVGAILVSETAKISAKLGHLETSVSL